MTFEQQITLRTTHEKDQPLQLRIANLGKVI